MSFLKTYKEATKIIGKLYNNTPKKNYIRNKFDVFYINKIWSMHLLDLNNYGTKDNKGYR